jgi:hypothetical protein
MSASNATRASDGDFAHHARKIRGLLEEIVQHAREDIVKVHEPKAQALLETTAEVLTGLARAYEHAEKKSEPAWR